MQKISSQVKLLVPIFTLIIILIFFSGIIIVSNYFKIVSLEELNEKILFSNIVSETLHSLQKERGLSSGYILNKDNRFQKELFEQRAESDQKIVKLKNFISDISCENFQKELNNIPKKLDFIRSLRADINSYKHSSDYIIKNYSEINSRLLEIIVTISKSSHIPKITQNILAYSNLLYLKEYAGIQRAEGIVMLSKNHIDIQDFIKFINLSALQNQKEKMFLQYGSKEIQNYYNRLKKSDIFYKVSTMQKTITKDFVKDNINPKNWYDAVTKKLNTLDRVSKYIKTNTNLKIIHELNSAKNIFLLVIILSIFSFFIFIIMLIAFIRLSKEEKRLRIVMDKYIISSITDLKGIITDASEAFCKISGYTKKELIGKNHNIVRHPDMPKEAFRQLWSDIQSGKSWSSKVKNRKKDGGFYWVYAHIEALYDKHDNIDSYISVRMDITQNELLTQKVLEEEKKNKLQNELMHQQYRLAQMGEMLGMIAHQWRQPLSAITAAIGVIELKAYNDKLDTQIALQIASKIKNFTYHLSNTIDDFRNFFKSNKEKNITSFEKILQSVLVIIESSLKKNNIQLNISYNHEIEFETYENELKQVLLNLIKNAEDILVEKNIQNPKIQIDIDGLKLIVNDNGGGVPDDIKDKIFDPYFSTKLKKDGTGLGLYMSKIIVDEHCNGKLSIKNNDDGALFTINLGSKDG